MESADVHTNARAMVSSQIRTHEDHRLQDDQRCLDGVADNVSLPPVG